MSTLDTTIKKQNAWLGIQQQLLQSLYGEDKLSKWKMQIAQKQALFPFFRSIIFKLATILPRFNKWEVEQKLNLLAQAFYLDKEVAPI